MWQSTSAGRGGHIWWTWGLRGFREEVTDGGGEIKSSTCSFLGERRKSWELQKKREGKNSMLTVTFNETTGDFSRDSVRTQLDGFKWSLQTNRTDWAEPGPNNPTG